MSLAVCLFESNNVIKVKEAENLPLDKRYIRVFPNPSMDGKVHIISMEPGVLHFYVFDTSGTLTNQVLLNQKTKQTITGLDKGEYIYDVFKDDESIEQGRIVVK